MTPKTTALVLALSAAFAPLGAVAQSNAEMLNEIKSLKARIDELERKLQSPAPAPAAGQWGMTPEQAREQARIAIKAEALQDAITDQGLNRLKISGYADPTFIYNQNQKRAGFQFLNNVADDGYTYFNSYFGAVMLDLQKETDSGVKWRLALAPNRGTDSVIGNGGVVHEASVSIPLGDLQTRLIAGHVPDWSGYEYLPATQNKLITHNMLFDYTLPTTYTGAGMEVLRGKWLVKGMLANVNATRPQAGQKAPAFVYRVDYAKGEFNGFGFAGVHGKMANFADGGTPSRVNLFEADGYFIRGDWTLQGQISYGRQKGAAIAPDPVTGELRDAQWTGLSGLMAYKFTPRFEGIARVDYVRNRKNGGGLLGYTGYWDPSNAMMGEYRSGLGVEGGLDCVTDPTVAECNRGANRSAISLGLNYMYDLSTTLKLEYRLDRADRPVFEVVNGSGGFKKTNSLFGASVLVAF